MQRPLASTRNQRLCYVFPGRRPGVNPPGPSCGCGVACGRTLTTGGRVPGANRLRCLRLRLAPHTRASNGWVAACKKMPVTSAALLTCAGRKLRARDRWLPVPSDEKKKVEERKEKMGACVRFCVGKSLRGERSSEITHAHECGQSKTMVAQQQYSRRSITYIYYRYKVHSMYLYL